jgi:hypothetical protein
MNSMDKLPDTMFTLSKSTPDTNRFYSILLDTKASAMTENMYDTAEKLLLGEKSNAKNALEQLWALKKNMQKPDEISTIDLLIQYYQNKIDVLRAKEEHIKKISRDSRGLLEDKRKRDAEVATIKQEITDCSSELKELNVKLEKLKIKEQELSLIESQLKKELVVNENEIVNGLYEIIIASSGGQQPGSELSEQFGSIEQGSLNANYRNNGGLDVNKISTRPAEKIDAGEDIVRDETSLITPVAFLNNELQAPEVVGDIGLESDSKPAMDETDYILYKQDEPAMPPIYPKSVVKTTRGRVVGEYYYDAKTYKNKRHYIFNSKFFLEQLSNSLNTLKIKPDDILFTDLLQMIQDAGKRISGNPVMHFEIATNELLNDKTIKDLWQYVKTKNYHEAAVFAKRLNAKIGALGSNYQSILKEQMTRYLEA